MHQPRSFFTPISVLGIVLICSATFFAQPDVKQQLEPSYDVSLQIVIGSDEASPKGDLPSDLSNVSRQLKSNFKFSNYRLASTLMGRISNTGNFEYKSVSNVFGQDMNAQTPSFMEWSMVYFRSMPNAKGQNGFQTQSFKFGARVPVLMSSPKDESGKMVPSYNYENIGLSIGKVGLSENTPTLIGTLNLPGTGGTIFLIMTVRSAD